MENNVGWNFSNNEYFSVQVIPLIISITLLFTIPDVWLWSIVISLVTVAISLIFKKRNIGKFHKTIVVFSILWLLFLVLIPFIIRYASSLNNTP